MFIIIEDDVFEGLEKVDDPFEDRMVAIDALFDSMYKCKHIVSANVKNLRRIRGVTLLNARTRRFVGWILKNYSIIYSCKNNVNKYISISTLYERIEIDENCYKVPIEYMKDVNLTKLLTENESDAITYMLLSRYMQSREGVSFFSISFENDSYHGANGKSKINQVVESKRIGLCVVDTDQDYPTDKKKSTYKTVRKAVNCGCNKSVIGMLVLPFREKENMFPATVYKEYTDNRLIEVISKYYDDDEIIANYFDIKDGVKIKKIINANKKWNDYYKPLLVKCKSQEICNDEKLKLLDRIDYENYGEEVYIDGIKDKLCDYVADALFIGDEKMIKRHFGTFTKEKINMLVNKRQEFLENLPKFVIDNWSIIANEMFTWGCCIDKKRFPSQRNW